MILIMRGNKAKAFVHSLILSSLLFASTSCGDDPVDGPQVDEVLNPYASEVVGYTPGEGAGYGQDKMPDVVLGGPKGKGTNAGSLAVLSLGKGGEIVLGFGDRVIVDGPGADFVVFENSFWPGGNAAEVYAELGEVSVSMDGVEWKVFPCSTEAIEPGRWPGCAGWSPTLAYDADELIPLDPVLSGGDAFDLADIGVKEFRFVRIRDVSNNGDTPSAGFDLDAVGGVYFR